MEEGSPQRNLVRGGGQVAPETEGEFRDHLAGWGGQPRLTYRLLDLLSWAAVEVVGAGCCLPNGDGEQDQGMPGPVGRRRDGLPQSLVVGVAEGYLEVREIVKDGGGHARVPLVQLESGTAVVARMCQVGGESAD